CAPSATRTCRAPCCPPCCASRTSAVSGAGGTARSPATDSPTDPETSTYKSQRRQVMKIKHLAALAASLAVAFGAAAADIKLVVSPDQPGPVIHRNIYGQFAEHLGTGIYEGIWVGPDSKIPNVRGWRKDVVGALKDLHVPLVRWPGGC